MNNILKLGEYSLYIMGLVLFLSKAGQNIAFIISLLLFLVYLFFKNKLDYKININKYLSIPIIILIILTTLFSFISTKNIDMSFTSLGKYIKYLFFFPFVAFINEKKKIINFFLISSLSLFISSVLTYVDFISNKSPRPSFAFDVIGFANIISIGALILLSYLVTQKFNNPPIILFLFLIFLISIIVINQTRGVYIAFIFSCFMLFLFFNKKLLIVLLLFGIGTFIILPQQYKNRIYSITETKSDVSNNLRLIFWEYSTKSFLNNPIFGVGEEYDLKEVENYYKENNYYEYVLKNYKKIGADSHNGYLHMLSRYGLLGIFYIIYSLLIIPIIWLKMYFSNLKEKDSFNKFLLACFLSGYTSYIIGNLTETLVNKQVTIYFLCVLLGILNYLWIIKNQDI